MPPTRVEEIILPSLTKTEIELEVMQDRINLVMLSGKPKDTNVSLMKDHSNLSKAFFQINFEDHVGIFSFHFLEMADIFLHYDGIVTGPPIG